MTNEIKVSVRMNKIREMKIGFSEPEHGEKPVNLPINNPCIVIKIFFQCCLTLLFWIPKFKEQRSRKSTIIRQL